MPRIHMATLHLRWHSPVQVVCIRRRMVTATAEDTVGEVTVMATEGTVAWEWVFLYWEVLEVVFYSAVR